MANFANSTLLVTGASGHLGRKAVESLLARGAKRVVAMTRSPDKLRDLAAKGVEVRAGSFDEPASLDAAFKGIDRLLLISTDAVGVPGGRKAQHIRGIDAAERAGVGYIAYTSLTAPYPSANPASVVPDDHFWTEARLAAGKADWSSLRNNLYTEGILQSAGAAIASGKLYHAQGTAGRASVAHDDAAEAAAGALLLGESKRIYDVGGPAAVTQAEVAAILSGLSGRSIEAVALSGEDFRAGLRAAGVPEAFVGIAAQFDIDTAQGYHAIVTDAVEQLTGRKPRSVEDVLAANAAKLAA
ncbi:NAD(P)H-binding protein [Paradevosia shaoguanensis]|uniref:NAD(P)H-binding protein n=1 Tax=Paradevosia shaoguanensis TaxID=1335043 RepID=A0AA41UDA2_9HYPH|nr:NAD(P)H-binding protein [Paradevosia shaoguanensis]MCF1742611.1 NAD(P)H-binding protein [Paradevosia shaoguanensis]MCI0127094.1 NAD(P)H-binding protein [Paradevosia shaoguanensis]